jgi:hypothetical protein
MITKLTFSVTDGKMNLKYNKIIYALFVIYGIYLIATQQIKDAPIYFGIALAFDPFNPDVKWNNRPIWQKGWLLVHLLIVVALFIYSFFVL